MTPLLEWALLCFATGNVTVIFNCGIFESMSTYRNVQRQYQGYLQTPLLWEGLGPFELHQLSLPELSEERFDQELIGHFRLGKLVERFVCHDLSRRANCRILAENIQVQDGKQTLGEFDFLLRYENTPIHLEVVYKFYIYHPTSGKTFLDRWIGPNRKDSLVLKLNKLKQKQLPLLYKPQARPYLIRYNLKSLDLEQRVLFKAQLFVPYEQDFPAMEMINTASICGYYIHYNTLSRFVNSKFHLVQKHDWLKKPHKDVAWINYDQAWRSLAPFLKTQYSPLVWVKNSKGNIDKIFVIYWN